MKAFALAAVFVLASTFAPSCATVQHNLPTVLAYVQDGMLILDELARFAPLVFAAHPDAALQAKVDLGISKARTSLDAALRLAQGAEHVDQAQIDAAFADFKAAYLDVTSLLGPYGVTVRGRAMVARSSAGGLVVPQPLAFEAP